MFSFIKGVVYLACDCPPSALFYLKRVNNKNFYNVHTKHFKSVQVIYGISRAIELFQPANRPIIHMFYNELSWFDKFDSALVFKVLGKAKFPIIFGSNLDEKCVKNP